MCFGNHGKGADMPTMPEVSEMLIVWKSRELLDYARAFVRHGLNELNRGQDFFGSDEVPEASRATSPSVPGAVASMLARGKCPIIRKDKHTDLPAGIEYGQRTSKAGAANGRRLQLWRLASRGIAEAFVRKYGDVPQGPQQEMALDTADTRTHYRKR